MKRRQYDAGGRALKKIAGTNRHLVRRSPVVCPFYRLNTIKYLHPNANISTWSLQDILAGDIRRLLVFNFMVDVQFLLREVPRLNHIPIDFFVGDKHTSMIQPFVDGFKHRVHGVPVTEPFGSHHTKVWFAVYDHGIRMVVSTANILDCDFHKKNQGNYVQDFPLKVDQSINPSRFEKSLASYFGQPCYRYKVNGSLSTPMEVLKRYDYTLAIAHFVPHIPGRYKHALAESRTYGLGRLTHLLSGTNVDDQFLNEDSSIDCQFSSLGSWQEKTTFETFTTALRTNRNGGETSKAAIRLVVPTVNEVAQSIEGWAAGGEIPISSANHKPFLTKLYYRFAYGGELRPGERASRERAMPHIKTYTLRNCKTHEVAWFVLTSANMSVAAWGQDQKGSRSMYIRSFEAGILIEPALLNTNLAGALQFTNTPSQSLYSMEDKAALLRVPAKVKLTCQPYSIPTEQSDDVCKDYLQSKHDDQGKSQLSSGVNGKDDTITLYLPLPHEVRNATPYPCGYGSSTYSPGSLAWARDYSNRPWASTIRDVHGQTLLQNSTSGYQPSPIDLSRSTVGAEPPNAAVIYNTLPRVSAKDTSVSIPAKPSSGKSPEAPLKVNLHGTIDLT